MKKSIIKEKRYKKAVNIKNNNLKKEEKGNYECSRKSGLVKIFNTRADKRERETKDLAISAEVK